MGSSPLTPTKGFKIMGLFSTTIHTHSESHSHSERLVPYEKTVHEHRAVTDESVKLLNEFQEKAIENVLHSFKLKDNIIEADGFFIQSNFMDYNIGVHCKFKINSKEYYVKDSINCFEFRQNLKGYFESFEYRESVIRLVYKKVSEIIAEELIMNNKECVEAFLNVKI